MKMNRKLSFFALACAASCAAAVSADLPSLWRSWKFSRAILFQHADALNYIALNREIFEHSENRLADLRIVDELGAELPYDLRSELTAPAQTVALPARVRENSFAPGQFTQIVVDLGKNASFHNSVRVLTPESDFINWVEVAASDDAHLWRIVKSRAPISRFRRENLEGTQTLRFSENNARYLRLRIQEPGRQFPVTGVEVFSSPASANGQSSSRPALPLSNPLAPDSSSPASQTQWTVDLDSDHVPVAQLQFQTTQPEFFRAVRFLASPDAREWQPAGGGEIYRYAVGDKIEESLAVPISGLWGPRYLRIEILNQNDAPLSAPSLSLFLPSRFLIFEPHANRSYRLIYGDARAPAPVYDFARTLHLPANFLPASATLGAEEFTSNYADPRPFTERHPSLLWIALALAVLVLGFAALRALRSPSAAP